MGLFFVQLFIFLLMAITMICYHIYRKQAELDTYSYSFYVVFIILQFWIISRIIYFTDAFYNYSFNVLTVISTMP